MKQPEMCNACFLFVCFGGGEVISKYNIDSGFHLFWLILLQTSFLELYFCHFFQVYNLRLKSAPKIICLLQISVSSSIFCKIFNCSYSALDVDIVLDIDIVDMWMLITRNLFSFILASVIKIHPISSLFWFKILR